MFEDNKYTKFYFRYVKHRQLIPATDSYTEKHHIIPRCLGGDNSASNLVSLSAREHFIIHKILTKMYKGNKMLEAFATFTKNQNRKLVFKPRDIEAMRAANALAASERNKGNEYWKLRAPDTDADRRRKSVFAKSCKWMNNGKRETFTNEFSYYESINYIYGRLPFTEQTKANMKEGVKHLKDVPRTEEVRKKISESHKGKTFTKEHRANLSKSFKQKPRITCKHCNGSFTTSNHTRWHGDNCKHKSG